MPAPVNFPSHCWCGRPIFRRRIAATEIKSYCKRNHETVTKREMGQNETVQGV